MTESKREATPGVLNVLMDVGSNSSVQEFHQWYNQKHGPTQMATKGFQSGLRYEASDGSTPKWLATYEVEDISVLQIPDYNNPENNFSPEEARILKGTSFVGHNIYRIVHYQGHFQPKIGTTLLMVRLLVPSVNAQELESWYKDEHIDMLAQVPGWSRSRLFVETTASHSDLIQYMALHEYLADNGLEGPKHLAARNTDWRTRIMSLSIGGPIRRDFSLIHIL